MKKRTRKDATVPKGTGGVAAGVVLSKSEAKDLLERDPRSVR